MSKIGAKLKDGGNQIYPQGLLNAIDFNNLIAEISLPIWSDHASVQSQSPYVVPEDCIMVFTETGQGGADAIYINYPEHIGVKATYDVQLGRCATNTSVCFPMRKGYGIRRNRYRYNNTKLYGYKR